VPVQVSRPTSLKVEVGGPTLWFHLKIIRSKGNHGDVDDFLNTLKEASLVLRDLRPSWPILGPSIRKLAKDCPIQQRRLHVLGDVHCDLGTSLGAPHAHTGFEANVT
jgi:hypothetical protein